MFQVRSLLLILLPALLPRHHIVVGGESTVSPATRGSSLVSCKEFTFTVEDLKNAKSDEELLNIWSSKMAEVVEFIGDNLQTQNGDIIINTAIVSHDATTATAVAIGTSTIATTSHAPFVTSITGTNTITSSDAIWHTPLAAIMGGTSVTLYTLAETTIADETNSTPELYTCYQLQKYNGTTVSGIYAMSSLIDEYEVHCNFSSGTGSCADNNYKCNCDQNSPSKIVQDDGFLNDTSKLPVRELKFGDMNDSGEESWHTLGKLECMGQSGQA